MTDCEGGWIEKPSSDASELGDRDNKARFVLYSFYKLNKVDKNMK